MRDDKIGSNSDCGKPASDEPSAMKVACPVQKAEWSAFAIRAGALHFFREALWQRLLCGSAHIEFQAYTPSVWRRCFDTS
jgi:hypothetical protein